MNNKAVNEMALAVGGVLAGWEIDPGWVPLPGDSITIRFDLGEGRSGQVPVETTITLTPFSILAAKATRAGGQGIGQTLQASMKRAAEGGTKGGKTG